MGSAAAGSAAAGSAYAGSVYAGSAYAGSVYAGADSLAPPGPVQVTVRLTGPEGPALPAVDRHLRVLLPAPPPWPQLADVLVARGRGARAVGLLAARHPAALVTAVHDGGLCWMRLPGVRFPLVLRQQDGLPWPVWASLAHAWLTCR